MTPRLNILGAGRAARVVARWLHEAGQLEIGQVANASLASARESVGFIGAGQAVARITGLGAQDWLLLGLPDRLLEQIGERFSAGHPELAFHLSGSLPSSLLHGLAQHSASVHPARAFADPERSLQDMPGTWVTVEGDDSALKQLEPLFLSAGARWQTIDSSRKPLYHAATVVASNYLVTLTALARELAQAAGVSEPSARALLSDLQAGTLANLDHRSAASALTGPIERGDLALIERLQAVMQAARPESENLLDALGLATLRLAQTRRAGMERDSEIDSEIQALFTRP